MSEKKLSIEKRIEYEISLTVRNARLDFSEWLSDHFPFKIPTKKPTTNKLCQECGKPLDRIIAYNTGDGWEFFWDCQDGCSTGEEEIEGWYPFLFGVWCTGRDLAKIGIEEV